MNEQTIRAAAILWSLVADLEALKTEREGMVIENASRALQDLQPAYDEAAFQVLAEHIRTVGASIWNRTLEALQ